MLIGYARVSTHDQTLNLQLDRFKEAGCTRIFEDHISGTKAERPGLQDAMSHLRGGDTLVVWRLDRLGCSLRHLIDTITELQQQGIGFKSLQENIDTTSSEGKLIFHVFGALAEFERDLIRERTQTGLEAARARGKVGGRPKVPSKGKAELARCMYADKHNSVSEICKTLGISRMTLWRYLRAGKGKD
jgi:DNA invertase Pin-like site-specific DNA recombinase